MADGKWQTSFPMGAIRAIWIFIMPGQKPSAGDRKFVLPTYIRSTKPVALVTNRKIILAVLLGASALVLLVDAGINFYQMRSLTDGRHRLSGRRRPYRLNRLCWRPARDRTRLWA
jgi:hypothetical protein